MGPIAGSCDTDEVSDRLHLVRFYLEIHLRKQNDRADGRMSGASHGTRTGCTRVQWGGVARVLTRLTAAGVTRFQSL